MNLDFTCLQCRTLIWLPRCSHKEQPVQCMYYLISHWSFSGQRAMTITYGKLGYLKDSNAAAHSVDTALVRQWDLKESKMTLNVLFTCWKVLE